MEGSRTTGISIQVEFDSVVVLIGDRAVVNNVIFLCVLCLTVQHNFIAKMPGNCEYYPHFQGCKDARELLILSSFPGLQRC